MPKKTSQLTYPSASKNAAVEKEIAFFTSLDDPGMERELTRRATEVRDTVLSIKETIAPIFANVSQTYSEDLSPFNSANKWKRIHYGAISFSRFLCIFVSMMLKNAKSCADEVLTVSFESLWRQSLPRRYCEFWDLLRQLKDEGESFQFLIDEQLHPDEHDGIEYACAMAPFKAFAVFEILHRYQIQDLLRIKGVQTTGIASLAKVKRLAGVVTHLHGRVASVENEV